MASNEQPMRLLKRLSYWAGELALRVNGRSRGSMDVANRELRRSARALYRKLYGEWPTREQENEIIEGKP
jgi:hypothetical protein